MSMDDYRMAWQAAGPASTTRTEVDGLIRKIKHSEQKSRNLLRMFAFNTVAAFAVTGWVVVFRRPIVVDELAPAVLLQVLLAAGLGILIRRQQLRRNALQRAALNVQAAARIGLENVAGQIRDTQLLAGMAAIVVPLLAVSVYGLVHAGKMDGQSAWGFACVCIAVLAVNAAIQWHKYRYTLVPRRSRLEQLVASLSEETVA